MFMAHLHARPKCPILHLDEAKSDHCSLKILIWFEVLLNRKIIEAFRPNFIVQPGWNIL